MWTRRRVTAVSLGALACAAMPAQGQGSSGLSPAQRRNAAIIAGVRLGCSTYTFSPARLDQAVQGIADAGFTVSELHPSQIEPAFVMQPVFPTGPGRPDHSTERSFARNALRQWRLGVPMEHFTAAGQRFRDAGIKLAAYNVNYGEDFSDAEIDRCFEMTKALGTDLMTAVGPVRTLRRLARSWKGSRRPTSRRHGARGSRSTRSPASTWVTAPAWSASTGWPIRRRAGWPSPSASW